MTMNRDLFLVILSMDSYNRGYGQNVKGLSDVEITVTIYFTPKLAKDPLCQKTLPLPCAV